MEINNKNILTFLTVIALTLTACQDDYSPNESRFPSTTPASLKVSQSTFQNYFATEASYSFTITAENVDWEFIDVPEWVTLSQSSGSESAEITLTMLENTVVGQSRTATFMLTTTNTYKPLEREFYVTQSAPSATLSILPETTHTFDALGGSYVFLIESNCDWTASTETEWIDVVCEQASQTITVTVPENPNTSTRNGSVRVTYNNSSTYKTIGINQYYGSVTATPSYQTIDKSAQTVTFTLSSAVSWSAETSDYWLQATPTAGTPGSTEITVNVDEYVSTETTYRTGYIYIYTGSNKRLEVRILQRAS